MFQSRCRHLLVVMTKPVDTRAPLQIGMSVFVSQINATHDHRFELMEMKKKVELIRFVLLKKLCRTLRLDNIFK